MKDIHFLRTNGKIINKVDFSQVMEKASGYQNFSKLREDISWFHHNCSVLHANDSKILEASKEFVKFIDEEITSIISCTECFSNDVKKPGAAYVTPCSQVHSVIWSKSEGFGFWPAKVLLCKNDMVHVHYFADHSADRVHIENCYKYSKEPPEVIEQSNDFLYIEALRVSNYQEKYRLCALFSAKKLINFSAKTSQKIR